MGERLAETADTARQCDRCRDEAAGLGSSARCICGPNVPCGHCGQGDQMMLAVRAMAHHADEASRIDRTGWTQEQWIEDAERLMSDIHGSVSSLVNGHVIALLDFWRNHKECSHAERCCRVHGTHSMPHKGCILR